ncbi:MAG: hypothetical protein LBT98_04320 [Puniceicoccales bacterium]|nr:hypothetical protein [Puniceicoccales bacterium]
MNQRQYLENYAIPKLASENSCGGQVQRALRAVGPFENGADSNLCFFYCIMHDMRWQNGDVPANEIKQSCKNSRIHVGGRTYNAVELRTAMCDFLLKDEKCKEFCRKFPFDGANMGFEENYIKKLGDPNGCEMAINESSCYAISNMTGQSVITYGGIRECLTQNMQEVHASVPGKDPPGLIFTVGCDSKISRESFGAEKKNAFQSIACFGAEEWARKNLGDDWAKDEGSKEFVFGIKEALKNDFTQHAMFKELFELGTGVCKRDPKFQNNTNLFLLVESSNYDEYCTKLKDKTEEEKRNCLNFINDLEKMGVAPLCLLHDGQVHYNSLLNIPVGLGPDESDLIFRRTGLSPSPSGE